MLTKYQESEGRKASVSQLLTTPLKSLAQNFSCDGTYNLFPLESMIKYSKNIIIRFLYLCYSISKRHFILCSRKYFLHQGGLHTLQPLDAVYLYGQFAAETKYCGGRLSEGWEITFQETKSNQNIYRTGKWITIVWWFLCSEDFLTSFLSGKLKREINLRQLIIQQTFPNFFFHRSLSSFQTVILSFG